MNIATTFDPQTNTISISGATRDDLTAFIGGMTGSELKVHMALAMHLDDENKCFPGLKTLQKITKLSVNPVRKALDGLEAKKILVRAVRKGTSTLYRITNRQGGVSQSDTEHVVVVSESDTEQNIKQQHVRGHKVIDPVSESDTPQQLPFPKEWQPVQEKLLEIGIKPAKVEKIITKCQKDGKTPKYLAAWIDAYEDARRDERAKGVGWLIKAIEDNWELDELYQPVQTQEERRLLFVEDAKEAVLQREAYDRLHAEANHA